MVAKTWYQVAHGVLTVAGGWIGYFLGGMDGMLIALMVLMVIDYATGLLCAIVDKKLSSGIGFRGICKKVLILLMVGVAHTLDRYVIGSGEAVRGAVLAFYICNEGVSILENAIGIGLPVPTKLREVLNQVLSKAEKGKEEETEE